MIASGPTDGLTPSFNTPPTGYHMPHAGVMMEQPAANAPLTASNAVNMVFRTSPLAPFHNAVVEGYISLGGTAVGASLGPNYEVLIDSGTQHVDDPNGEVIIPITTTIPMGAWHDMTADGIRLMGRNLYFLFCLEGCADGLTLDRGILISACYREQ